MNANNGRTYKLFAQKQQKHEMMPTGNTFVDMQHRGYVDKQPNKSIR